MGFGLRAIVCGKCLSDLKAESECGVINMERTTLVYHWFVLHVFGAYREAIQLIVVFTDRSNESSYNLLERIKGILSKLDTRSQITYQQTN